jgi:hypothetical protein
MLTIFWLENLKVREQLEVLDADGKIILEGNLGKWSGRECGLDAFDSGCGSVADSCENGNASWGSMKGGESF